MRNKRISKKFMGIALSTATVLSSFAPLNVLAADPYTVSINFADGYTATAVDGNKLAVYTPEDTNKENPNFAVLREGTTDKGTASCSTDTSCTITVEDGIPTKLYLGGTPVYEENNPFNFDTTIAGNMSLTVKNASAPVSSNVEVSFATEAIAGNVATFNVNDTDVTVTVTGSNITQGHVNVPSDNLGSVIFTLGNTFNSETMQVVVRGTNNYNTVLAVNNGSVSLNGLNLPEGGIILEVESKNNGGENDPVQPGPGEHFDGKTYLVWSCGSGVCYHYFDNMEVNNRGTFIKASTIHADNDNTKVFDVNADRKFFASKERFEEWKTNHEPVNWNTVNIDNLVGQDGIDYQPVGEPMLNNAYVSYADRNFKAIIYNDSFRGLTIGDLSDLTYYPGSWKNELTRQDSYDISGTTKLNPVDINTVLLENTINLRSLNYNGFEIKSIEALDVPTNAVTITKNNDGSYKFVFSSHFYDKVVFRLTDTENNVYYFRIKREAISVKAGFGAQKFNINSEIYYDRSTSYNDYIVSAKVVYKDGTTKIMELENAKHIDDGLGNSAEIYENDEENPSRREWPHGKGLKRAAYKLEIDKDEAEIIDYIYVNVEYKGSTETSYAGAYAGSGKGEIINMSDYKEVNR